MDLYVVETVQGVFDVDASPDIRPMTHYVEDPESITKLFDNIAYDKCKYDRILMDYWRQLSMIDIVVEASNCQPNNIQLF